MKDLQSSRKPDSDSADTPETELPPRYHLNITVVYQGEAARARADKVVAQAVALVGGTGVCPTWLNMDRLCDTVGRSDSVWAVALADILVLSFRGDDSLPLGFHDWIMQGLVWRCGRKALLVALPGTPQQTCQSCAGLRVYVEALATSSGMDFLVREPEWAARFPQLAA